MMNMKKVFISIVAVVLAATAVYARAGLTFSPNDRVTATPTSAKDAVGTIYFGDGVVFKYVQFGQAFDTGEPAIAEASATRVKHLTAVDTVVGVEGIIGFSLVSVDSADFGWLQIAGSADVSVESGLVTVGNELSCGVFTTEKCRNATAPGSDVDVGINGDTNVIGVITSITNVPGTADSTVIAKVILRGIW